MAEMSNEDRLATAKHSAVKVWIIHGNQPQAHPSDIMCPSRTMRASTSQKQLNEHDKEFKPTWT